MPLHQTLAASLISALMVSSSVMAGIEPEIGSTKKDSLRPFTRIAHRDALLVESQADAFFRGCKNAVQILFPGIARVNHSLELGF